MEQSRTRKSVRNIVAAVLLKIFRIILPFISRTVLLKKLGIEYVGLSGLFNSVIGVLSLAEMGVGAALVYAMYQPVKEENQEKICAILALYRKAYLAIGSVVLGVGLIISFFIDKLVKAGTYPSDINIHLLYIIFLVNTVITYLVYAYKASLLDAHQMGYLASKVKIRMLFVQYIVQIGVLLLVSNYYAYVITMPICTLIICLLTGRIADRNYPQYKPIGTLEKAETTIIFEKVKSLFLYKIGSIVLNSVDSIIISWYFGAAILGIYNNYYYIVSSLFSLLLSVSGAITPSVGDSLVSESKEKNYNDFMMFSAGYNWAIGFCMICLVCLMQPFIEAWIGTENMLPIGCVVLFGIYFYCFRMGDVVGWYKDAAGLWEPDRYRPIISSIVNLTLNIILIRFIGIYGILISTIVALIIINFPIAVKILLRYFEKKPVEYVKLFFKYLLFSLFCLLISYIICYRIDISNLVLVLVIRMLVCISLYLLFTIVYIRKDKQFHNFTIFILKRLKR